MRKMMMKSHIFGGLFPDSRILKGIFESIFVNYWAVSFYLHT